MRLSKKGRGRPSEIERLPMEADHIVEWAKLELGQRRVFQNEIRKEFNEKLAVIGLGPISKSSFNRHSITLADKMRKRNETLAIAREFSARRTDDDIDDMTLLLSDTLKSLINELLEGKDITVKETLELSRAFQSVVSSEKITAARRRELNKKLETGVNEALKVVSREKGLTKEQAETIKREVLGLKE